MPAEKRADQEAVYQLELSPEQRTAIEKVTGQEAGEIWLTIQEWEERICAARHSLSWLE